MQDLSDFRFLVPQPKVANLERLDGSGFVLEYLEDLRQLRHLKKVANPLRRVQELYDSPAISKGRVRVDEFPQPGAVDIRHASQVDEKLVATLGDAALKYVAEKQTSLAR